MRMNYSFCRLFLMDYIIVVHFHCKFITIISFLQTFSTKIAISDNNFPFHASSPSSSTPYLYIQVSLYAKVKS